MSIRSTPSSTARRSTLMHSSWSLGGPQTPLPVICMAPNPRRWTVEVADFECAACFNRQRVWMMSVWGVGLHELSPCGVAAKVNRYGETKTTGKIGGGNWLRAGTAPSGATEGVGVTSRLLSPLPGLVTFIGHPTGLRRVATFCRPFGTYSLPNYRAHSCRCSLILEPAPWAPKPCCETASGYSAAICAPFSATERRMSRTRKTSTAASTAETQNTSK